MKIDKKLWGQYEGKDIWLYTLSNSQLEVTVTNLGCTIVSIIANGDAVRNRNIVLAYSSLQELIDDRFYINSMVGRFAGRISRSTFSIDKERFTLPSNDGQTGNHLHGGRSGFNKIVFREISQQCGSRAAVISFFGKSKHLDQGYPGNLDITFNLTLSAANELTFSYFADSDRSTHINLTHHLYYNLCGNGCSANDQELYIQSSEILDADANYIPTGKTLPVKAELNFNPSKTIAARAFNDYYILNKTTRYDTAAVLMDPQSGLAMRLTTTCPMLVFYSGDFLEPPFSSRQGICLETQYYPDAPNRPEFPSTLYKPGKIFKEYTKLTFSHL